MRGICALAATIGFLLLSASPVCASTGPSAHSSIVGGQEAAPGQFPYLAFVADIGEEEAGLCTGSVVAPNMVLTAAHCVINEETDEIDAPERFRVVTGNVNWTASPREVFGVTRIMVYPNYHPAGLLAGWGDAALLELSANTNMPAISLASTAIWRPGTGATMAGWGQTERELPVTLMWAPTVVQSKTYCQTHTAGFHPSGQICVVNAPSYSSGACFGDSGGPLLAKSSTGEPVEIGIMVSVSNERCLTSVPQTYTRSDLVASWEASELRKYPPAGPIAPPRAIPTLTSGRAKSLVRRALREGLGGRATATSDYKASCRRIEATKQRCGVNWFKAPNDYYGYVTIYYAREADGTLVWNDRYTIRWVNNYCYYYSGHPRTCRIHLARG